MTAPSGSSPQEERFDKYDSMGAYHWREADPRSRDFNPPLAARYQVVFECVWGFADAKLRILDVGCGDGYLLGRLSPLFGEVVGIEPEPAGLQLARRQLEGRGNCRLVGASAYRLPFGRDRFDLVTCTDVIEHLTEPSAALAEMRRVLRPGGTLVLTTPQWRPDRKWDHRHVREYRAEELKGLMAPFFKDLELRFFWPLKWYRLYATRIGWRIMPTFCRLLYNPFLEQGHEAKRFGQLLAVAG